MAHKETFISRQFKTLSKKSRSRSGSLLLLVVIILAVSLILITSALSLTLSARSRYYGNALSSQAKLTATSVAKTIGSAVLAGDITDAELQGLADANGKVGSVVPITVAASATKDADGSTSTAIAPGLKGVAGTSYTTATISYYPNSTAMTYIRVKATTYLDTGTSTDQAVDSVSVFFKKVVTADADAFSTMCTVGGGAASNVARIFVGDTTGYPASLTPSSNYAVFQSPIVMTSSDSYMYSDVVFTDQATFDACPKFFGNLIFSGDTASISTDSKNIYAENSKGAGNMLVLGDSMLHLFTAPGTKVAQPLNNGLGGSYVKGSMYLLNADVSVTAGAGTVIDTSNGVIADTNSNLLYTNDYALGGTAYRADDSASVSIGTPSPAYLVNAAIVNATLQALADKYTSTSVKATINRKIRTSDQAYTLVGLDKTKTGAQIAAAAGALRLSTLIPNALITDTTISAALSSAYYVDTTAGDTNLGYTDGYSSYSHNYSSITVDLSSGPVTIFIIGTNGTFTIDNGLIRFVNGSNTNIGRIILLDGTDLMINSSDNGTPFDSGIVGTNHVGAVTARTTYQYGSTPYVYIYGMGNNVISVGQKATLEGYIGLYGSGGTIKLVNSPYFYGRLEVSEITAQQGDNYLNYCPAPSEKSLTNPTGGSGGGGSGTSSYVITGYITE